MSAWSPDDRLKPVGADPYNTAITWLEEPLRGAADGPLAGRTLLVKDLIDTAGIRTTYGSRIYADHVPDAHATVVQRALDAGAVVVGKANLADRPLEPLDAVEDLVVSVKHQNESDGNSQ